jgi:hypothetical protein
MPDQPQDIFDFFAGQALNAILSNNEMMEAVTKMGTQAITYEEAVRAVVKKAYDVASAMMVERSERRRAEPEFTFKGKRGKL